ncbi:MAG: radical SAM protein [Phycisphaerales bacterium]|nr:radical SAM protein [Phycisphaerales bacterium]
MKTVYIETFGCQMNELDSELVRGQLESLGYVFTRDPKAAEVLLYNTCSVREHAESKAYSRLGLAGVRKRAGESLILGVIGCMAERDGRDMLRRYPQVDLLCGPGELDKLPALIDNASRTTVQDAESRVALAGNTSRRSSALAAAEDQLETLDLARAFNPDGDHAGGRSTYVRITRGCNKFCTYCVVPYTRGAEVHRPPDDIVDECRRLADEGIIEITLLGQTVNHYRYTHGMAITVDGREVPQVGPGLSVFKNSPKGEIESPGGHQTTSFAGLLARIHDEVPAIQRLRFLTSYPRDFGDDVLSVMAERPRICPYLHVPAQSGSNRILKMMNRGYTVEEYLDFVERVLDRLPNASIAGDIIVGFPTETDEDFEMTKALLQRVPFKNNYIFKYSPRPGTTAINRFPDDVPIEVKKARNNALLALQAEISGKVHAGWVGREVDVFFERLTHRNPDGRRKVSAADQRVELGWDRKEAPSDPIQVAGRTPGDMITCVETGDEAAAQGLLGTIQRVQVTSSGPLLLRGKLITDNSPGTSKKAIQVSQKS